MTEKYGFVYIWFDRKHKRYYVGSHWGTEDDGYVCSSPWMKQAYLHRPQDFKRKIIKTGFTDKVEMRLEEERYLKMIKPDEIKPKNDKPRYYNLHLSVSDYWHHYPENIKTVGQKISASKSGKKTGPRDPSVGEAISKAKKGKALTEEHKAALSRAQRGTKQSEETKRKRSESLKGHEGHWKGKKHSEETKAKMRESHRMRKIKAKWNDALEADLTVVRKNVMTVPYLPPQTGRATRDGVVS